MSFFAVLACTVLFFPVYHFLRFRFYNLPLHRDSGFYVSNHTIMEKRFSYQKGWNCQFALCSKLLPEFFYSMIYLSHGSKKYPQSSRFLYSIYNYATGVAVGALSWFLGGKDPVLYFTGLALYALISSEPHFGVYFESAEQFEGIFQLISFFLIYSGMLRGIHSYVFWGFTVLLLESFFIKTSSLITALTAVSFFLFWVPQFWPAILKSVFLSVVIWIIWVRLNGRRAKDLIFSGAKHESYWQSAALRQPKIALAYKKLAFLINCMASCLPLFAFCFFAFFCPGSATILVFIYFIATFTTAFLQSARIWYFLIPTMVPLALLGAFGIECFARRFGWWLPVVAIFGWVVYFLAVYRRQNEDLNLKVWKPYGSLMARQNESLRKMIEKVKPIVKGESILIYGVLNQAYLQIGSSYPTNLTSGAAWLDFMMPSWQKTLNRSLVHNPPNFILSTDSFFDIEIIRERLGLAYELAAESEPFRLYQFQKRLKDRAPDMSALPYNSEAAQKARRSGEY